MTKTMRAARMHKVGQPLSIDAIEVPTPGPTDVLIEVKACGIVPNLGNVLNHLQEWFPHLVLPRLPAISGSMPPSASRSMASAPATGCTSIPRALLRRLPRLPQRQHDALPELLVQRLLRLRSRRAAQVRRLPVRRPVRVHDRTAVQHRQDSRQPAVRNRGAPGLPGHGLSGAAARRRRPGHHGARYGISGTLGIGAALFGLAMGVRRILGTGRNRELLQKVKQLAPNRIHVMSLDDGNVGDWAREMTDGEGAELVIDALGPGAPQDSMLRALQAMRRGGHHVNIGAVAGEVPVNLHKIMDSDMQLSGSAWFTTGDGQEMADMVESGAVDLSCLENCVYKLEDVNTALGLITNRNGGFSGVAAGRDPRALVAGIVHRF